jgi:hypothetical protein
MEDRKISTFFFKIVTKSLGYFWTNYTGQTMMIETIKVYKLVIEHLVY